MDETTQVTHPVQAMNHPPPPPRWTAEKSWLWYNAQPWLIGANFLPSTAINQLEMFQRDYYTQNRATLVRELDMVSDLGFNTLRIFLHDLLWEHEGEGFFRTLDDFLTLCDKRRISPLLVFFDDCHRPAPRYGVQPDPTPGIHNPGWAQSPGLETLMNPSTWGRLEKYVKTILKQYSHDSRVLAWDLYNEPLNHAFDNCNLKQSYSLKLLSEVWGWAREASPKQPLTSCIWAGPDPLIDHSEAALNEVETLFLKASRMALDASDFITFHNYGGPKDLARQCASLQSLGRPLVCTEYMARTAGSTFQSSLPLLCKEKIGAYNWGMVSGKSQTIFPWGSPVDTPEPRVWFHDILRPDGTPHDLEEIAIIRRCIANDISN